MVRGHRRSVVLARSLLCGGYLSLLRSLFQRSTFHPRLAPFDRLRAGYGLNSIAASRLANSLDAARGLKPTSIRFQYAALKGRSSTVVRSFEVVPFFVLAQNVIAIPSRDQDLNRRFDFAQGRLSREGREGLTDEHWN